MHCDSGIPTTIGAGVSVGHAAVLHGCTVEDDCLIGMSATVLNHAVIGAGSLVAAGSVVLEGTIVPPDSLVAGVPAKVRRELTEEEHAKLLWNAEHYVRAQPRLRRHPDASSSCALSLFRTGVTDVASGTDVAHSYPMRLASPTRLLNDESQPTRFCANTCGVKPVRSPMPSPWPTSLIGMPVLSCTASTKPPLAEPSSLVSTSPVTPACSMNASA